MNDLSMLNQLAVQMEGGRLRWHAAEMCGTTPGVCSNGQLSQVRERSPTQQSQYPSYPLGTSSSFLLQFEVLWGLIVPISVRKPDLPGPVINSPS
jgi:hypothetical protein